MMIGSYPCCNGDLFLPMTTCGKRLPVYVKQICPHCGSVVWHKFSRIDPQSWTEEHFLREFDVDEETKEIKER